MDLPPFQLLLDSYSRDVHRFLVASVGPTDADDCYQETWIAALRGYPKLQHAANLRGWLLTIASRKATDCARKRARVPVPVESLPESPAPGDPEPTDADPWSAVRALPPKQRTAVAMRYGLDADYTLISETMGITEDAARRNVHEGLKRLREEYER